MMLAYFFMSPFSLSVAFQLCMAFAELNAEVFHRQPFFYLHVLQGRSSWEFVCSLPYFFY